MRTSQELNCDLFRYQRRSKEKTQQTKPRKNRKETSMKKRARLKKTRRQGIARHCLLKHQPHKKGTKSNRTRIRQDKKKKAHRQEIRRSQRLTPGPQIAGLGVKANHLGMRGRKAFTLGKKEMARKVQTRIRGWEGRQIGKGSANDKQSLRREGKSTEKGEKANDKRRKKHRREKQQHEKQHQFFLKKNKGTRLKESRRKEGQG